MPETIAPPSATFVAGYASGYAAADRNGSSSTGENQGASFTSVLRSAEREGAPRSNRSSDDHASEYAGAAATAANAPVPPQPPSQPAAGEGSSGNGDGGQAKDMALASLQGRVLTLLAGQSAAATVPTATPPAGSAGQNGPAATPQPAPPAAAGLPGANVEGSTAGAVTAPQNGAQSPAAAGTASSAGAAAAGFALALPGGQVQAAIISAGQPATHDGDPREKSQKDTAGTTAVLAGMPATRAAYQPALGAWAPAHRPEAATTSPVSTATHTTTATSVAPAALQPPAAAQPRLSRPAAPAATGAWTSAGTRQADGLGDSTPIKAIDQVADGLVMTIRQGKSEATISLRPASLGEVKVQLSTGTDGLIIRLAAEHDATGDLLRAHMGELREVLAGQQIAVSELHVLHNPPAPAAGLQNAPHDGFTWQERPQTKRDDTSQGDGSARPDQDAGDETDRE